MNKDRRIVSATIGPMPASMNDPMPAVTGTFDDGETINLFEFYPDEISFQEAELVGLTENEARDLKHQKDLACLEAGE